MGLINVFLFFVRIIKIISENIHINSASIVKLDYPDI